MSKRDYELIAGVIKDARNLSIQTKTDPTPEAIAKMFADRLGNASQGGNPRFNRATFLRACGVDA